MPFRPDLSVTFPMDAELVPGRCCGLSSGAGSQLDAYRSVPGHTDVTPPSTSAPWSTASSSDRRADMLHDQHRGDLDEVEI